MITYGKQSQKRFKSTEYPSPIYTLERVVHFKFYLHQATRFLSPPLGDEQTFLPRKIQLSDTKSKASYPLVHLLSPCYQYIENLTYQTVIYSTFHNTPCQTNKQTIKIVTDNFNFVYYSFVHSMRPHITSVADLKLNYILTLLTYP